MMLKDFVFADDVESYQINLLEDKVYHVFDDKDSLKKFIDHGIGNTYGYGDVISNEVKYYWDHINSCFRRRQYITVSCDARMKPVCCENDAHGIKDVIFNPPATIVIWNDGTKTVVKTQENDIYDPEVGLAMAFSKKMLGNEGNYYNVFKKWLDKYYADKEDICPESDKELTPMEKLAKAFSGISLIPNPTTESLRVFDEYNTKLKQLTGYDLKEVVDAIAAGKADIEFTQY